MEIIITLFMTNSCLTHSQSKHIFSNRRMGLVVPLERTARWHDVGRVKHQICGFLAEHARTTVSGIPFRGRLCFFSSTRSLHVTLGLLVGFLASTCFISSTIFVLVSFGLLADEGGRPCDDDATASVEQINFGSRNVHSPNSCLPTWGPSS